MAKGIQAELKQNKPFSGAGEEVQRLIERFQIPLLTTMDGKGIVAEGHPLSVGIFCDAGHASAWKAFRHARVVLCIGNALNQHATFNYREDLFDDKLLIHINISAQEIDREQGRGKLEVSQDERQADRCADGDLVQRQRGASTLAYPVDASYDESEGERTEKHAHKIEAAGGARRGRQRPRRHH